MKKILLIFLSLSLVLTGFISAHTGEDNLAHHASGGMMSGVYGWDGFMWFFGWIFMVLFIVVLVFFIIWLIKQIQKEDKKKRKK